MKTKTVICALLGIVSLASCNKTISEVEYPEGELCSLMVNASSEISVKTTGSKETITANEKLIKSLQVFVFRGDFLDAYQKATTSSVSLTCTAGERRVYAVVNAPDLSSISSKSALEAYLVDLSANTASSLVMTGVANATLPGEKTVNIAVNRMVARVVVNKISREFESASLGALKFVVKGIYAMWPETEAFPELQLLANGITLLLRRMTVLRFFPTSPMRKSQTKALILQLIIFILCLIRWLKRLNW